MQFWNELEGKTTEDGLRLGRLVRSEGRTAWFEIEEQEVIDQPATLSLTESLTDADEVIERLEAAQRLEHPNLMTLHAIGRTRVDGTLFVYALMEHADQNLGDIVHGHAMDKEEVRDIAEALVSAISAIHQQGLVHGRVEPASILAVGEWIKLRSDCLQAPGGTRAGDVAGIGDTIFQCFTQRKAQAADDPQINRIPAPFGEIVRNSLNARWGLAQIAGVLRPQPAPNAPATPPPMPRPAAVPAAPPPAQAVPHPEVAAAAPIEPEGEDREAEEHRGESPARSSVIYAVIGVLLLIVLGWLVLRHKASPTATAPTAGSAAPAADSAPSAAPEPTSGPSMTPSTTPGAVAQPPAHPQEAHGARTIWRVVAYTYNRQDQAQHKADEINHDHPDLNAAAYQPQGDTEHHLVVFGGEMDRQGAQSMLEKAHSEGFGGDVYIQNFSN